MSAPPCSVCERHEAEAGGVSCGHRFCDDCFGRYIRGSVDELNTSIRCCICGTCSVLTRETLHGKSQLNFGRETAPKLRSPVGLGVLSSEGIYVTADLESDRVYLFDDYGRLLHDFAYTHGTKATQGIAITADNEIALSCTNGKHHFVSFFKPNGAFVGSAYTPGGAKCNIRGIAAHKDGWFAVSDGGNKCIYVINQNKRLSKTIPLDRIKFEVEPIPNRIAVDEKDAIIVTDQANHCVKVYRKDGEFIYKFGSQGERPGQFESPSGVAVSTQGFIAVADTGNHRVQLFTPQGKFIRYVVCYNQGYDVFMSPGDVTFLPTNQIAVLLTKIKGADVGEVRLYN